MNELNFVEVELKFNFFIFILNKIKELYNIGMKLVTGAQMKKIDEMAINDYQIDSIVLMEQAGMAIYTHFIEKFTIDNKICIVCGSGNNGGDGLVLARLLSENGYDVKVWLIANVEELSKDALTSYKRYKDIYNIFCSALNDEDIIVDAVFGTGLSRIVNDKYARVIEKINDHDSIKVSIDVPSGIDSYSGKVLGMAIVADYTFTLQIGKIGLYLNQGRLHSGGVSVLDIGIPNELIESCDTNTFLIEKKNVSSLLPKREVRSNKGSYGKVLCIGGSDRMSGAISLAALSALRSGCGSISCAVPKGVKDIVAGNLLESMTIGLNDEDGYFGKQAVEELQSVINNYTCVLFGCGIGRNPEIKALLEVVLKSNVSVVIDADGIYAFKELIEKYKYRENIIVTPHLKEFSYLFDKNLNDVIEDSLSIAVEFAKQYPEITLVLKSETTLIVKDEITYINTYGNNGLAKGGSGDVLAGIITGIYAQNNNPVDAAVLGVFLHSYSSDILLEKQTVYSIIPSDIFPIIDKIVKNL